MHARAMPFGIGMDARPRADVGSDSIAVCRPTAPRPSRGRRHLAAAAVTAVWLAATLLGGEARAAEGERPVIVNVVVSAHLVANRAAQARVTYRAAQGNVARVIVVVEDLDGSRRETSQREISVVAAAFGREEGELTLPLGFATPGRRLVTFTLLTDEREESDPASVEIDVGP
jgi:hypothetical protein